MNLTGSIQQRSDVTTVNQSLLFQRDVVEIIGFKTNGLFQTTDRRKAKSKRGEEEANQDLTWKRRTIGSEF